jgi:hypothetical protein
MLEIKTISALPPILSHPNAEKNSFAFHRPLALCPHPLSQLKSPNMAVSLPPQARQTTKQVEGSYGCTCCTTRDQ